jgi:hypothetical protein
MTTSPRTLNEPRDSFGTSNLENAIDRRKIDA